MRLSIKAYHYFIRSLALLALLTLAIIPLCYSTSLTTLLLVIPVSFLLVCGVFVYLEQIALLLPVKKPTTVSRQSTQRSLLSKMFFCCR